MKTDVCGGRMSRVKAGTAALLAAAIFWGGARAAFEVPRLGEKLLVASAALTLPQGAAAVLKHRFGEAEQAPPTEESVSAADTESSREEYFFEKEYPALSEFFPKKETEKEQTEEPQESNPLDSADPKTLGVVTKTKYTASEGGIYIKHGAGMIKNSTSLKREQVEKALAEQPWFDGIEVSEDEPLVLIVHTHATESYERYNSGKYDKNYSFRSTDNTENMVAVGETLAKTLEQCGIKTVQATVQHDNPSYNGSYNRSAETVKKYLELYPNIKFVLDVHRDAIEPQKGKIVKPVAEINGKTAAQVMIISGCDDGTMNMPDYLKNLQFAAALQDKAESMFPGLMRPVFFCYRKYNMDLSPGALLIEVGSHGNTLDEAKYSAELIGQSLAELLLPKKSADEEEKTEIKEVASIPSSSKYSGKGRNNGTQV